MKRNFYRINHTGFFFCFFLLAFFSFQSNAYPAPSSYFDTVQKTYIGYYQRAADPGGLIYWANRLDARAGNLNEIIEAFANEPESQALYGTINSSNISTVVDSIYNALFGRDAEHGAGGLDFWVNGFNAGTFTAATIMLNILNAAQNEDLQSVSNKLTAANLFTRTIDPELDGSNFQVTYAGDADAIAARNFLAFVTWNPITVPTQDGTTAYIQTNIANPGDPILGQTPPSAPSNLSTTSGNTQAIISWSPVAGATSYNIYWSTTPGVTKTNGTKITGATSPYSHTGRTNGTTYYYIVTAVNSSGESMESAQVSATPTAVQDPPIKLFNAGVSPWINDILEDSSNNILVAGEQDDGRSIVVLKLSSAGTQVWNKYFPAGTYVNTNNIFEVPSQGYLLTGGIESTLGSLFKMPIDPDGTNSAPSYFFPDCGPPYWASGPSSNDSVRLSDGSVIFAGAADFENNCGIGIDYGNAVITGINSSGTQYFWSDYDYAPGYTDTFNSVVALSEGGFAAAGSTSLYDDGSGYGGPYNAILVKTNAAGSVIWTKNYGYKTDDLGNSGIIDLIQTSDNGYAMLAWSGYYYDMYVIKTDSSGNSTSAFNAATGDSCYRGRKFVQSGDNGFVIVGQGSGCSGAVVKLSAAGAKVWEYNTDYFPTAIVKSASGGYLIAGSANVDMGVYKIFVFKLDDLGKRVW